MPRENWWNGMRWHEHLNCKELSNHSLNINRGPRANVGYGGNDAVEDRKGHCYYPY